MPDMPNYAACDFSKLGELKQKGALAHWPFFLAFKGGVL